jgi:hypothetical protein
MARCGYCSQTDVPIRQSPTPGESGLATHNPPWVNTTCKGLQTYLTRPENWSAPTNPSNVVLRDDQIRTLKKQTA